MMRQHTMHLGRSHQRAEITICYCRNQKKELTQDNLETVAEAVKEQVK